MEVTQVNQLQCTNVLAYADGEIGAWLRNMPFYHQQTHVVRIPPFSVHASIDAQRLV